METRRDSLVHVSFSRLAAHTEMLQALWVSRLVLEISEVLLFVGVSQLDYMDTYTFIYVVKGRT